MTEIKAPKVGGPQNRRFGVNSSGASRSPNKKGSIDPKNKSEYFKDNVQDPHDQEDEFDPNMYYYRRQDKEQGSDYPASSSHFTPTFPLTGANQNAFSMQGMHHGSVHGNPSLLPPQPQPRGPLSNSGSNINIVGNQSGPLQSFNGSSPGSAGNMGLGTSASTSMMQPPPNGMMEPAPQSNGLNRLSALDGTQMPTVRTLPPPNVSRINPMNNMATVGPLSSSLNGVSPPLMNTIQQGPPVNPIMRSGSGNVPIPSSNTGPIPLPQQHFTGIPSHSIPFNSGLTSKLPPAKPDVSKGISMPLSTTPPPSIIGPSLTSMLSADIITPGSDALNAFDMSEFPALSARSAATTPITKPEFNLGADDFPALPGYRDTPVVSAKDQQGLQDPNNLPSFQALGSGVFPSKLGAAGTSPHSTPNYNMPANPNLRQSSHGIYASQPMSLSTSYDGLMPPPGSQQPLPRTLLSPTHQTKGNILPLNSANGPSSAPAAPSSIPAVPNGLASGQPTNSTLAPDRYGLLGLLSVIRMTDPDLNTLALGTDLTTLGLNLNSPDCLYATFASPFADSPSRREPEFYLPHCYYTQPPMQPPTMKMTLFNEETLFYIFYSMPRDTLQIHAATELYGRDWRYHKEHKLWFTRVHGTEPIVKTSSYERGSYFYFDPNAWEKMRKDNFVLCYDQLETVVSKLS